MRGAGTVEHYQSRLNVKHSMALQIRRLRFGVPRQKVFCVGFQKTGTTSLQYALSLMGYRVAGIFSVRDLQTPEAMLERALNLVPRFDAFGDNPWPSFFRELDIAYPGSKFILTTRDPEQWYDSAYKHFGKNGSKMREWIYSAASPVGHSEEYINRFTNHALDVRDYFAERPADFLEFDVAKNDGWEALCAFLDKPVPRRQFPRLNTASMRT